MNISTVFRKQRARLSGLGARIVDVTPGAGAPECSFSLKLWNQFEQAMVGAAVVPDEWWVTFELAMWELALRHPVGWLMLLQSDEMVFVDNRPYASQTHPRVITALMFARVAQTMGYSVGIDGEYSTPYTELKRKPKVYNYA